MPEKPKSKEQLRREHDAAGERLKKKAAELKKSVSGFKDKIEKATRPTRPTRPTRSWASKTPKGWLEQHRKRQRT